MTSPSQVSLAMLIELLVVRLVMLIELLMVSLVMLIELLVVASLPECRHGVAGAVVGLTCD